MCASPFPLVVLLSLLASIQAFAVRPIRYVRANAPNGGNGQSWATAFNKLQDGLAAAQAGDDVWVAQGTYYPDAGGSAVNDDRNSTFALKNDVAIYGGFDGTSNVFSNRNPANNVTTLHGDIYNNPIFHTERAYHVVTGSGVNTTAILDGFTITEGNADNNVFPDSGGGGLICRFGSPKIVNCIFTANTGLRLGGGVYIDGASTPAFTGCAFTGNSNTDRAGGGVFVSVANTSFLNCTFSSNHSESDGGGLYLQDCTSTLTNCTFNGNTSDRQGGAILLEKSSPTLTGCGFTLNTATAKGGAIFADRSTYSLATCSFSQNSSGTGGGIGNYGSSPTATSCTFTQNTATDSGGAMTGTTNFTTDPATKSNPNLSNCTFTGNTANIGGALFLDGSETSPALPIITSCTFTSNTANNFGGAIQFSHCSPQLTGSSFTANSATSSAGAVSFMDVFTAVVSGCHFQQNQAPSGGALHLNHGGLSVTACAFSVNSASVSGGAMTISNAATDTPASIASCSFSGNTSATGGAVNIQGSGTDTPSWTNCSFIGNSGSSRGGAIDSGNSSPVFRSCAFSGNLSGSRGGAGYFGSVGSPAFTNCTVSGNAAALGGALSINNNSPALANCIIFNNQGTSGSTTSQNDSLQLDNGSVATFTHCLIANFTKVNLDAGTSPDTNLEPVDPKFTTPVNPASAPTTVGNLALKTGSPAIDTGSNAALSLTLDLAGKPRVFNSIIDLGAFENQGPDPFFDDLDGDGISGGIELALGTNPAVSDAGNPRNLRKLPGTITFGYDAATAATIALELRRSTDLVNFNVIIASSIAGFPSTGPGGIITITDPAPPVGKAFYRLQATPR